MDKKNVRKKNFPRLLSSYLNGNKRQRNNPKASHSETFTMMMFNKGCFKCAPFHYKTYTHVQVKVFI